MIVGQNTLLNQYVPTFYIRNLIDGQTLVYDSVRKAFINTPGGGGGGGATHLGELEDVSPNVDNPLSVQDGQALVYNSFSSLWENQFVDYNTLLNKPPVGGSVTTVSVVTANGVSGVVVNPTTTPAITLSLGNITPTSVAAIGTVTGSNLSGMNTGNQTITLTGAITGSGTGTFATAYNGNLPVSNLNSGTGASAITYWRGDGTWATPAGTGSVTNVSVTATTDITGTVVNPTLTPALSLNLTATGVTLGTYGSSTQVPVFTIDSKGRISNVTNTAIAASSASTPEQVVFHYSPGGSGNFTPVDTIFSNTSGVTPAVIDGANCIVTFTFTGKITPPKSIILYGQNFATNTFSIVSGTASYGAAAPNVNIAGGGTSASPNLANSIFNSANVVTLQLRMSDTGASSTIGNRAWAIVIFGF